MKIAVFNVKFSENLGDGVLAECLEHSIVASRPGVEAVTFDLAGRTAFGETHSRRGLLIKFMQRLPHVVRRAIVKRILEPRLARLKEEWRQDLATMDAVVIGGGNLFQDDDLNFPLKIGTVLELVEEMRLPLAVNAVGVARNWSDDAHALFARLAKTNVVDVSVRDENAAGNWTTHFPDGPVSRVCPDPALIAGQFSGNTVRPGEDLIGICVTSPAILARHASMDTSEIPLQKVSDYHNLIRMLVDAGYKVKLFTNGAKEDQEILARITRAKWLGRLIVGGELSVAPRPLTPDMLINELAGISAVVAHRLHACIVCYALGISHVGLGWDEKMKGFFCSTNREKFLLSGKNVTVSDVFSSLREVMHTEIDAEARALKAREVQQSVDLMIGKLMLNASRAAQHDPKLRLEEATAY